MLTCIRALFLAVLCCSLVSWASADCSTLSTCSTVSAITTDQTTSTSVNLLLGFFYEPSGVICGIFSSQFTTSSIIKGGGNINGIIAVSGTVTVTGTPNNEAVSTIDAIFTTVGGSTGEFKGKLTPATSPSATISYTPFGLTAAPVSTVGYDACTGSGTADPIFQGFHGQRFVVKGEVGKTYNIISTPIMQMNTRLVLLKKGESLGRTEQKWARLKSLFSLPETHWFDHTGPYMSELGLVTLEGHQLYAEVGTYQNGWNTVTADGVNVSVTSTVVFGTGEDAVSIFRPNTHQLVIETAMVSLTVSNSDKFFNVDRASLKHLTTDSLGGALGVTADSSWKAHDGDKEWEKKLESEVLVESNDLFEMSPLPATAS